MAIQTATSLIITSTILFHVRTASAFNFSECKLAISSFISQNPNVTANLDFFWGGNLNNNLQPRYEVCEALCGDGNNTIAGDCGPRLAAWVLPILILVGGVKLPPLAWRYKLWAVLRLSGDPMGSLGRMVDELVLYGECIAEGERVAGVLGFHLSGVQVGEDKSVRVGTSAVEDGGKDIGNARNHAGNLARIIHGFSRAVSGQTPMATRVYLEEAIHEMAQRGDGKEVLEGFRVQVDVSGKGFIRQKSRSTVKPLLAVSCFILPVVIALVPQVAKSIASGGMMASILTLSPFVLMVLLGNSIGEYEDLGELSAELRRVMGSIEGGPLGSFVDKDVGLLEYSCLNLNPAVDENGADLLPGGCTNRRRSSILGDGKERLVRWAKRCVRIHSLKAILLLSFPGGIASAGIAIGTRPAFFQARHVLLIMVFVGWVFSWWATTFAVNRYSVKTPPRGKRVAWGFIAATHLLVAISGPVFLAGITCGLLGGCRMWSGYYWYGAAEARMPLNIEDIFETNGHDLYPALAGACIGANLLAFFVLRYWVFRRVFSVISGQNDDIKKRRKAVGTSVQVAS